MIGAKARLGELLSSLPKHLYLIWNRKRFGYVALDNAWESDGIDLIEHAPAEIRATDSLSLGRFLVTETSVHDLSTLMIRDAAILVQSDLPRDELRDSLKIAWGWYTRPSIFRHSINHSSEPLANALLKGVNAVVVIDAKGNDILLFGNDQKLSQLIESLEAKV